MNFSKSLFLVCAVLLSANACANDLPPIKPVAHVDLPRYMGKWYVIASIPTTFEKHAYNAVETYKLLPNGHVDTTFTFLKGGFDKPQKEIDSTGYVKAGTNNAVWGIQVFWPFKAQYIVSYLSPDYSQVIIARNARDYVWVMARTPTISKADYDALISRVVKLGYTASEIRKVPQAWPATSK